ncbi:MAG TPA: SurA N-terminal domain-containing protein [Blastocatellia bacterium]|nr:SurA N-terminal domain-containing protein [Blastocatellia bacterium]
MKFLITALAMLVVLGLSGSARAQEPELINEIVARVNNDIITRADYLNAMRDFKEELTRQMGNGGKSAAEIDAEFERLKPTVLDLLIEDLLLEQKAKELGIDVEADVNQRLAAMAKENGLPNVLAFENELKKQGMDPEVARASLRKQFLQQYVVQREVLSPIFQRLNDKDRQDFYDKHKDYFTTQGEVTLSEIFLPLEGHTATEVEQRARRVIEELKAGQSFAEAVKKNSPENRATRAQDGRMGAFKPGELKPDISAAISTLKPGEVTQPIRLQDGFQIIRVDERKAPATRPFTDPEVQNAISRAVTMERADEARKKYLKKLREEAFIEITKGYQPEQAKTEKKAQ